MTNSCSAKKIVAHGGAGEMPMPVPDICCQYVSPNWMTLLRKIICRASMSVVAL